LQALFPTKAGGAFWAEAMAVNINSGVVSKDSVRIVQFKTPTHAILKMIYGCWFASEYDG
jgi:hypothetical protein